MAENVKFVEFEKVPNAPKLAVPADFSQEQINEYLKLTRMILILNNLKINMV